MHGFAPEHALQSAKTYIIYFGLPMVAKYDKSTKEYVKASPRHIRHRFWQVIRSYAYTGSIYSIFFLFPNYFPRCGAIYSDNYFSLSYILSNQSLRNTTFYVCKLSSHLTFRFHCVGLVGSPVSRRPCPISAFRSDAVHKWKWR